MKVYEHRLRVCFQDTNLVGNVYFAQYFAWQGKCREAFLFDHAPQILDDFKKGNGMITKESSCSFLQEAFAGDRLLIEMSLSGLTRVGMSMNFDYYRTDGPDGRVLLAQGFQSTLWVNPEHRISVMPDYLYEAIGAYAADEAAKLAAVARPLPSGRGGLRATAGTGAAESTRRSRFDG
jgi:enediyne core biosynthesis thioesterase